MWTPPTSSTSAKTVALRRRQFPVYYHGVCRALFMIKELTSQQKRVQQQTTLMGVTGLNHVPQPSEAAGLISWWDDHLKIQLPCKLGWQVSPEGENPRIAIQYMVPFLS